MPLSNDKSLMPYRGALAAWDAPRLPPRSHVPTHTHRAYLAADGTLLLRDGPAFAQHLLALVGHELLITFGDEGTHPGWTSTAAWTLHARPGTIALAGEDAPIPTPGIPRRRI